MSRLKLYLFGPPRLERTGVPLDLGRRKAEALLAYLAITDQRHSRDALATLFWPESDSSRGRAGLSRTLSVLNKALGAGWVAADRETVTVNPDADLWVDVIHFQQLLADRRSHGHPDNMVCAACLPMLEEAAGLYQADFLTGFTLPDSPQFDEWQFYQTEGLRRELASALERLGRGYTGQDNLERAIVHVRRWVELEPLEEPARRQLMTLYAQSGQRTAALRQYQVCVELVDRELGVSPQAETTALHERIQQEKDEPQPDLAVQSSTLGYASSYTHSEEFTSAPIVGRAMKQQIRFCTTSDGVGIAYATVGEGPPLVKAANWLSHLEYDWRSPIWRHWLESLSQYHTLIRYDERGNGLSDWDVKDFSVEAWVRDLEAVVEAVGLDRFPLLGMSQGGPVAIAYAARHPEKVSHLILYGTFARGWLRRNPPPEEIEEAETWLKLIKLGWARENPVFRRVFASFFLPEGSSEQVSWFTDLARISTSTENAIRFQTAFYEIDVSDLAPRVTVPTLVLHARHEASVPFDEGRQLAALIPKARLVTLEGKNHIMLAHEPAWPKFLAEVHRFLETAKDQPVEPNPAVKVAAPKQRSKAIAVNDLSVRLHLPPQPTPFIGREVELADMDKLIANPEVRLVTIVGPGGIGKTRLALAAAERQLTRRAVSASATSDSNPQFSHGVYFVSLGPLSSVDHIVPTMAAALGFQLAAEGQQPRSPRQQILGYLRQKRLLLVMDNFEHLLDDVALLAEILQAAPEVKILATSRERLHLYEEQIYPIQGLEFPDWETPEDAAAYTAVKLFLQSARRIQPGFELEHGDLTYLTRICRLVEGLPLGVELAAAWVDMLSMADIATEIRHGLDFLETDTRNIPARHRSIRAVFDASWQHMSEAEREVFPQLSVFRGGFTRTAAQDVAGASLPLLATLANKSLLQYHKSRDRYQIHELLRQYGADKLAEEAVWEREVRNRHGAYYCVALQQRQTDLQGAQQQAALAEIEADGENAHLAWMWAVAEGHVGRLEQALDTLARFYHWRGRIQDGKTVCQLAVDRLSAMSDAESGSSGVERPQVLARVLMWQGRFERLSGHPESAGDLLSKSLALLDGPELTDCDTRSERAFILIEMADIALSAGERQEARQFLEKSLALYQELNNRWGMANALEQLSTVAWNLGANDEARQFAEESLTLRQTLGDQRGVADSLDRLGLIALMGPNQEEIETSRRLLSESITLYEELGDPAKIAVPTGNLGSAFLNSGDFVRARELYEQAVTIFSDYLGTHGVRGIFYRIMVGLAATHLGSYGEAEEHIHMGLGLAQEQADQRSIASAFLGMGRIALVRKDYAGAKQILGESIAIYRDIGQQETLSQALSVLSIADYALGDVADAEQHAYEGLRIVTEIQGLLISYLYALVANALFLAAQDKKERAVELYALAARYPHVANSVWVEAVAGQRMAGVAATLPPETVAAAKTRGQAFDLKQTALELLDELGQWGWSGDS